MQQQDALSLKLQKASICMAYSLLACMRMQVQSFLRLLWYCERLNQHCCCVCVLLQGR